MVVYMTNIQRATAEQWCDAHGCCLRLASQLVNGVKPAEVWGCTSRCPVTGETGKERDQAAIDQLAKLLLNPPDDTTPAGP